jgi:hypothetical protein
MLPKRSARLLSLSPIALALVAACEGSDATGAGGTPDAGALYAGSACEACDSASCGAARAECAADAACTAYLKCLGKCELDPSGDAQPACEASCAQANPAGGALEAFRDCRASGAGSSCSACGRAAGSDGGSAGGSGCTPFPQSCKPVSYADACIQCSYERCCEASDLVFSTPGPAAELADCWMECTTPACESDCYDQYPDGISGFAQWETCFFTQCGEPQGPCTLAGTCNPCIYDQCECEYYRCKSDSSCHRALECYGLCEDPACLDACLARYPQAAELLNQYQVCVTQRCGSQCGTG